MFSGLPCFSGSLSYRNESKALSAKVWAHGGDGPVRKAEMIVFVTRSGSSEKRTGGTSEGEGYNGYPASQRTSIPPPGCAGTKVGWGQWVSSDSQRQSLPSTPGWLGTGSKPPRNSSKDGKRENELIGRVLSLVSKIWEAPQFLCHSKASSNHVLTQIGSLPAPKVEEIGVEVNLI